MRKRTIGIVGIVILCVLIVAFLVLQANSLKIALADIGIDFNSTMRNVEELDVVASKEYKVIQGTMKDGTLALVQLEKTPLGFWQVRDVDAEEIHGKASWVEAVWSKHAGTQRYSATDVPEFWDEVHHVYCGNDALKWIEIPNEVLPENLTVNIQQIGSFYLIHVITFDIVASNFNIPNYLAENGYIPN